jgi:hypothetical protein
MSDEEPKPLNRKQQVFVAEYLKCWNASEAARRAGYSEKTAYAIGSELLRKPEIKALVDACLSEIQMSADEAVARNTEIARGDLGVFFKLSDSWMFNPPPSYEILDEKEVIETDEQGNEIGKRISYRVRRVVLDMDKVINPRYSHLLKKFTDSNRNGLGIEMYDAQGAIRDVLKMTDKIKDTDLTINVRLIDD